MSQNGVIICQGCRRPFKSFEFGARGLRSHFCGRCKPERLEWNNHLREDEWKIIRGDIYARQGRNGTKEEELEAEQEERRPEAREMQVKEGYRHDAKN